jgi:hypothetical protein
VPDALPSISGGWIKLYRCIQNNPLWQESPFDRARAWVDLIVIANHKDGYIRVRGNKVPVMRGQVGYSILSLAERWGWSRGKISRFLNELEGGQQIRQQKKRISTLITIINYEKYQGIDTTDGTTDSTTDGQQTDTNKNVKNEKKKSSSPESLRLSGLLADMILRNNSGNTQLNNGKRESTVRKWAADIDKLMKIEGQSAEQIERVIRWCQKDIFWKSNILSGATLRKQWDRLTVQMQGNEKTDHENSPEPRQLRVVL